MSILSATHLFKPATQYAHLLRWAGVPASQCSRYVAVVLDYLSAGQTEHVSILMARALYHRESGLFRCLESDAEAIQLSVKAGM